MLGREPVVFGEGFDAFGDDVDVQVGAGFEHGADDGLAGRMAFDAADEAHVELDLIGLEVGEETEAGVGGAEVVDGEADAEVAVLVHEADEAGAIVDDVGLGDFEDDAFEGQAGVVGGFDGAEDGVGEGEEAAGQEIEVEGAFEAEARGEGDCPGACELIEEVETGGRDLVEDLPGGLIPGTADEGFPGDDGARGRVRNGLEGKAERRIGQELGLRVHRFRPTSWNAKVIRMAWTFGCPGSERRGTFAVETARRAVSF